MGIEDEKLNPEGSHEEELGLGKREYKAITQSKIGDDGVEEIHVDYQPLVSKPGRATQTYVVDPNTGKGQWVTNPSFTDSKK